MQGFGHISRKSVLTVRTATTGRRPKPCRQLRAPPPNRPGAPSDGVHPQLTVNPRLAGTRDARRRSAVARPYPGACRYRMPTNAGLAEPPDWTTRDRRSSGQCGGRPRSDRRCSTVPIGCGTAPQAGAPKSSDEVTRPSRVTLASSVVIRSMITGMWGTVDLWRVLLPSGSQLFRMGIE